METIGVQYGENVVINGGETSKGKSAGPIANWIWKIKKKERSTKSSEFVRMVNLEDVIIRDGERQFQGKIIR